MRLSSHSLFVLHKECIMVRCVLGVITGYIVMAVFVAAGFSIAWMILKSNGAYAGATFEISMTWCIISIVLSLVASIIGGVVCMLIAKTIAAAKVLAGAVFILGIILLIPILRDKSEPAMRPAGEMSMMEAMKESKQPVWVAALNPVLGCAGVLVGMTLLGNRMKGKVERS